VDAVYHCTTAYQFVVDAVYHRTTAYQFVVDAVYDRTAATSLLWMQYIIAPLPTNL